MLNSGRTSVSRRTLGIGALAFMLAGCPNDPLEYELLLFRSGDAVVVGVTGCDEPGLEGSIASALEIGTPTIDVWLNGDTDYRTVSSPIGADGFIELTTGEVDQIARLTATDGVERLLAIRFAVQHTTQEAVHEISVPSKKVQRFLAAESRTPEDVGAGVEGLCQSE